MAVITRKYGEKLKSLRIFVEITKLSPNTVVTHPITLTLKIKQKIEVSFLWLSFKKYKEYLINSNAGYVAAKRPYGFKIVELKIKKIITNQKKIIFEGRFS